MPTGNIDGINFYHLPGDPHNTMCLEEAGVAEADAIIIGPADNLSSKEVPFLGSETRGIIGSRLCLHIVLLSVL